MINNKHHHNVDYILVDRGFTLEDEFAAFAGVELTIPSFAKGKPQLSAKEVETARQLASIRIIEELAYNFMKWSTTLDCYQITFR